MLKLSEFSYNHHPTGVKKLVKFIRRGFPVIAKIRSRKAKMETSSHGLLDHVRQFGLDLADVPVEICKSADHYCHQSSQHEHQTDTPPRSCSKQAAQEGICQGAALLHERFENSISQRPGDQESQGHHGL